jgi:acyl-CoA synthetase (AMP-forming)/AMP-acid ligase II/acyl carrier protein
VLQYAPLSFDASCQELFSTWQVGGRLVTLTGEEQRRDPSALLHILADEQIKRWFVPYVALQNVALWSQQEHERLEVRLHSIMAAGEQLQATSAIRAWVGQMPGCLLYNQYGPTESHIVTSLQLHQEPEQWALFPSIGRPIANTQIYLLSASMELVPVGVVGELYIGGINLARGYTERGDLTAARFVPHPFSQEPGARLYRTGDLARYREDGTIEFLGRMDHQMKLRGFRIEPGEIEAVLRAHPAIRDAVVLPHKDSRGETILVAYVVPSAETQPTREEMRLWLGQQVPDYMVPASFVALEAFPLTPSGKMDRRALPTPEYSLPRAEEIEGPRTPLEELIVMIWAEVLQIPAAQVSIHDDFFTLGGHSLLATQMVSRMRQQVQVDIPLRLLFDAPTIAGIAQIIEQKRNEQFEQMVVGEDLAQMITALESLSDEEVNSLLVSGYEDEGNTI